MVLVDPGKQRHKALFMQLFSLLKGHHFCSLQDKTLVPSHIAAELRSVQEMASKTEGPVMGALRHQNRQTTAQKALCLSGSNLEQPLLVT